MNNIKLNNLFKPRNIAIFLIIMGLSSCNLFKQKDELKILEGIKKYHEDYVFKNNLKVEFIDIRIIKYNELVSQKMDSLLKKFVVDKLIGIEVKLSKLSYDDMIRSGINYTEEAGNSQEFGNYVKNIKRYSGQKGFEAHVYLKYTMMDINGNHISNHIDEDNTYFLSKDFSVIQVY